MGADDGRISIDAVFRAGIDLEDGAAARDADARFRQAAELRSAIVHHLGDADQLEEERRLMYVAMTRARNHLAISYPLNVYNTRRGADYSMDQLSRFLDAGVRAKMQRLI